MEKKKSRGSCWTDKKNKKVHHGTNVLKEYSLAIIFYLSLLFKY